jgi:TonB-linked SusC/RagA family outer membrane protein
MRKLYFLFKKRNMRLLWLLFLLPLPAMAQTKITGRIKSATDNLPIPGASVVIKGTSTGITTNAEGIFSLNVPDNSGTLIISAVGYTSQEVAYNNNAPLEIALKESSKDLKEVVVIGYGTQSKHKVTSAISSVSGTELTKRQATDPTSLLQGQLPGLSVTQNSGQPGNEGISLLVRGLGTFSNAPTSPLIIVDGVPGDLSILNPGDIESVTLLKDAASEAIYGSRGANGVLVVKTKKGNNNGAVSLTYTYNYGISNATRLPNLITNSATYMTLYNQAQANSGFQPIYTQAQIDLYKNATDLVKYPNHNPLNDIFKTANVQNHYLSVTGGNNGTTYNLGFGITDQPGTMLGFQYKKYTFALGLVTKINKRVSLGVDLQGRYGLNASPENGGTDQFLSTLAQAPTYPFISNGQYIQSAFSGEVHNKNPLAIAQNAIALTKDYYAQGNVSLNVDIIDGLKWENRAGFNYDQSRSNDFRPKIQQYYFNTMTPAGLLDDGTPSTLYVEKDDNSFGLFYSQLSYAKQFGKHNISAIAGYEQQQTNFNYLSASRINYPTNDLTDLNAGPAAGATNGGFNTQSAIKSFYSRLNYDYDDKYLFGASFRRDGSSRFLPGHQWGSFYSFSAGWRISQEKFLKDVSWLNDLKIRGSYGLVGNQNIGTPSNANYPYPAQSVLSQSAYPFSGTPTTGFTGTQLVDPSLTWESTRTTDIGIDMAILNNKLSFTVDYFNKYTYNILRSSQVASWIGLSPPTINNGAVDNKGVEAAITYRDKIGKDFGFYVSPNFQLYRNKLVKFGVDEIGGNTINRQGLPINSYYMYEFAGIFQNQAEINASPTQPVTPTPGDLKIKDVNGDGKIDDQDRTVVSGAYPSYSFGINLGANYKQFDLSIQIYGVQGLKSYVTGWGIEPFTQGSMPTTNWLNAWTPTNPSNVLPKIYIPGYAGVDGYSSTYFLKDASFVRLKNVQLGYTIPINIVGKIGIKSLRVYAAGDNLLLFSKFPGLDPERTGLNGTYVNYPQSRTFTFGVSAKL